MDRIKNISFWVELLFLRKLILKVGYKTQLLSSQFLLIFDELSSCQIGYFFGSLFFQFTCTVHLVEKLWTFEMAEGFC